MSVDIEWPRRPIRANPLLLFGAEIIRKETVQAEPEDHPRKCSALRRFFARLLRYRGPHHTRNTTKDDVTATSSSPRVQLPIEIVHDIFECLRANDLESCIHVSKSWKEHISAESHTLPIQRFGSVEITFCVGVFGHSGRFSYIVFAILAPF